MGGIIRVHVEGLNLLFTVEENANAEKVQVIKKLLLEIRSGVSISDVILKELLKRIQGLPVDKEPDTVKRREVALRLLVSMFKNVIQHFHMKQRRSR